MHFHPDAQHKAGALIGAGIAFIRSMIDSLMAFTPISFDEFAKTVLWAFVGATVGFFTTVFWKWVRNKFFK